MLSDWGDIEKVKGNDITNLREYHETINIKINQRKGSLTYQFRYADDLKRTKPKTEYHLHTCRQRLVIKLKYNTANKKPKETK